MSSAVVAQRMSIRRLRPVERDLWNIGGAHSALMLAARITLPHFSVSLAMNCSEHETGTTIRHVEQVDASHHLE